MSGVLSARYGNLTDAADAFGALTPKDFIEFVEAAVSDEEHQELLARTLTIAQDTAMRDKRRALGRALAAAAGDVGTKVDDELLLSASWPIWTLRTSGFSGSRVPIRRTLKLLHSNSGGEFANGTRGASLGPIRAWQVQLGHSWKHLNGMDCCGAAAISSPRRAWSRNIRSPATASGLLTRLAEPEQ